MDSRVVSVSAIGVLLILSVIGNSLHLSSTNKETGEVDISKVRDFGSYLVYNGDVIYKGLPEFMDVSVGSSYGRVFGGYAGLSSSAVPTYSSSAGAWNVDKVSVTFSIKPSFTNVINCTLVKFGTDTPTVQPLNVYFINNVDKDYFCDNPSDYWSCVISSKSVSGSGTPVVTRDKPLTLTYDTNLKVPTGTCTVHYVLKDTMSYLWQCYFADGSVKKFTGGGLSYRDDLYSSGASYHGNVGSCISGVVESGLCVDSDSVGDKFVTGQGVVTTKVTQDCKTTVNKDAVCKSGECVCSEQWVGSAYCVEGEPSKVYRLKRDATCKETEQVYDTCASGEICVSGSCVPEALPSEEAVTGAEQPTNVTEEEVVVVVQPVEETSVSTGEVAPSPMESPPSGGGGPVFFPQPETAPAEVTPPAVQEEPTGITGFIQKNALLISAAFLISAASLVAGAFIFR